MKLVQIFDSVHCILGYSVVSRPCLGNVQLKELVKVNSRETKYCWDDGNIIVAFAISTMTSQLEVQVYNYQCVPKYITETSFHMESSISWLTDRVRQKSLIDCCSWYFNLCHCTVICYSAKWELPQQYWTEITYLLQFHNYQVEAINFFMYIQIWRQYKLCCTSSCRMK